MADIVNNNIEANFELENVEFDAVFEINPSGSAWGDITGTLSSQTDLQNELDNKADLTDLPTVNNATITIQKNGSTVESFTLNQATNETINITVPTTASDVGALPNSTNYGASIDLSLNTTDYKLTLTLKDQNGNTLNSKVVDFPIESVVVSGRYDSTNKKIVLTLQNGTTIDIPVGDLVAGLQTEITSTNKLDADLVDDSNSVNKFVTASEKTTWNNKQDALVSGTNIKTINNISLLGSGNIDIQGGGGGSSTWGSITGTLSNQTDLQNALNEKQDVLTASGDINIGANWTNPVLTNLGGNAVRLLAYGNGKFVSVDTDEVCKTSADGVNWTETVTLDIPDTYGFLQYGNGKFVLGYSDEDVEENVKIITSLDGATWTQSISVNNNYWDKFCLVFNGTNFVIFGGYYDEDENYFTIRITSADGLTWSEPVEVNVDDFNFEECQYINGIYALYDGSSVITSTDDGITWSEPVQINSVDFSPNGTLMTDGTNFIVLGRKDRILYTKTSTDGVNWTVPVPTALNKGINYYIGNSIVKDSKCFMLLDTYVSNLQQHVYYFTTFKNDSIVITANSANYDLSNLSTLGRNVIGGSWSNRLQTLISSSTSLNGTTPLSFTMSKGTAYEVLLRCVARTGTTNGDSFRVEVRSDLFSDPIYLCGATTRSDSYQEVAGSCILPVSETGKIYVNRSTSFNGEIQELTMVARRRMGTNS